MDAWCSGLVATKCVISLPGNEEHFLKWLRTPCNVNADPL